MATDLVAALREAAGSDWDALDDFAFGSGTSVEDIVNEVVPGESALDDTPLTQLLLARKIQDIRSEIASATSALNENQDVSKLSETQVLIENLLSSVHAVRSAASTSDAVVREITKDIQTLDTATSNINTASTLLLAFTTLDDACGKLEAHTVAREYTAISESLDHIRWAAEVCRGYTALPRVAALRATFAARESTLKAQLLRDFDAATTRRSTAGQRDATAPATQLSAAAALVTALDAAPAVVEAYTTRTLADYRRIFGGGSEAGALDNVARRFAWCKRALRTLEDEHSNLFPAEWCVAPALVSAFAAATRSDLRGVLERTPPSVPMLLEGIRHARDFEDEVQRRYGLTGGDDNFRGDNARGSSGGQSRGSSGLTSSADTPLISDIFEPHLTLYIAAQDTALGEMAAGWSTTRGAADPRAPLASSTELFYVYREVLDECAALSTRAPLLELAGVYGKRLREYAGVLVEMVRNAERPSAGTSGSGAAADPFATPCLVINTAEYCLETTSQLESSIREKIDTTLASSIDFSPERDAFLRAISTAVLGVLAAVENNLEPGVQRMLRSPWRETEHVASESAYVIEMTEAVKSAAARVSQLVEHKKYLRNVCDKIVALVLAKFTHALVRCRPLPQTAAEQLLLDLKAIRQCLMGLMDGGDNTLYAKHVTKNVQKLDTLLKTIMTPQDPAEDFVNHYLLLIPCQSLTDFLKVLDLKGVRKGDQTKLTDVFLDMTSSNTQLSDTSFLTSLDMDPPPNLNNSVQALFTSSTQSAPSSGVNSPNMNSLFGFGSASLTPTVSARQQHQTSSVVGEDKAGGIEALQEFRRFGAKIGMASRFFSQHS